MVAEGDPNDRWKVPGSLELLCADLARTRPAAIVDLSVVQGAFFRNFPLRGVDPLRELVETEFEADRESPPGMIYARAGRR